MTDSSTGTFEMLEFLVAINTFLCCVFHSTFGIVQQIPNNEIISIYGNLISILGYITVNKIYSYYCTYLNSYTSSNLLLGVSIKFRCYFNLQSRTITESLNYFRNNLCSNFGFHVFRWLPGSFSGCFPLLSHIFYCSRIDIISFFFRYKFIVS